MVDTVARARVVCRVASSRRRGVRAEASPTSLALPQGSVSRHGGRAGDGQRGYSEEAPHPALVHVPRAALRLPAHHLLGRRAR